MIEKNIIACFLMSDHARTFIPRANPIWFTGWYPQLIKVLQDMYNANEPIGIHTVYKYFKDKIKELAFISNSFVTDVHLEKELLIMEVEYNQRYLIEELTKVRADWSLDKIQDHLELINQNSRVQSRNRVLPLSSILSKKVDEIEERINSGNHMKGISTGWSSLDKYMGGWNKGNLVVVGGRPGMGKSALGLNFCTDGSPYAKYLFVSIEMSADELAERIIADMSGIENTKVRNAKMTLNELQDVVRHMYKQSEFHIVDTKDNNVFNIISLLKLHKVKYGLDVVVIDYLQKLDAGGRDMRTNVGMASTALKNCARELGITVIALAQLNRDGKNARPELTELKESGQIEQDADVVLFPFRPSYYEEIKPEVEDAVVIIAKNRHGRLCEIPCTFTGSQTRYRENF